jgi:hypothetical protein|tara:strand:+ start:981 stop:1235 length:255 start_codon:yes stop_codon:yes gene_type:complete
MFFLVEEETFPITFPAEFAQGVSMNEAVRQPIELFYPHKYRFSLPWFFMQLATPIFPPDGTSVAGPTKILLDSTGRTSIDVQPA